MLCLLAKAEGQGKAGMVCGAEGTGCTEAQSCEAATLEGQWPPL